jgi:hypothetical protein
MRLIRAAWPLVVLAALARQLAAQVFTRPELHWETLETAHFELHFPRSMQAWALDAASRLEAVQGPIVRLVGNAPSRRVTVVIDDPYNVSNGAALPILTWPTIVLWPTPPGPSDDLGTAPDWAALLAAHEFAHIAQLTWPSRNATDRTLWRVLPVELGPVARRAPRWVMEAYAVYVEGLLEGGRPHSAARAAVLRQWAIEGRLPSYGELDGSPRFLGDDMEYLLGSAFLEWLVAHYGEASLPNVWRRLSARVTRDFNTAFIGVYGDSPAALYGRFTAELTGKALRAADLITAAGLDSGETFQHLTWYTGDPAVSAEGRRVAVPVRVPGEPTRIVVWSTALVPVDSARIDARRYLLKRDSGDVPAVHPFPAPRTPMATLDGSRGSGYDMPRFFADTVHLLVSHPEPRPDGAIRPELFEWNMRSGDVRRITHGAAVRDADPAPDGRTALGVRCLDGTCDLVRVQLSNGHVDVLLTGSPTLAYNHPRFAPNGRSAVVAVRDTAGWHDQEIDLNDIGVVATRRIGPDDGANRYGPAYVANGSAIVTVSDWGGIEHLETIDKVSGAVKILAVTTGGISAPDASPVDSMVYFLTVSARGRDLHRVPLRDARDTTPPMLPVSLAPAAVPGATPVLDLSSLRPVPAPTPYGLGPRQYLYLPAGAFAPAGWYFTLGISSSDPVGRLAWTLQGAIGDPGTWRGGAIAGAWRGLPVTLAASAFGVSDYPSRQDAGTFAPTTLDASLVGGVLSASLIRYGGVGTSAARLGVSVAHIDQPASSGARALAFAGYSGVADFSRGMLTLFGGAGALISAGRTEDVGWQRLLARASVNLGLDGFLIHYAITYAQSNSSAPVFERPVVGGSTPPLTDTAVLSQRISELALPVGVVSGSQILGQRLEDEIGPLAIYYDRFITPADHSQKHDLFGGEFRGGLPPVPFLAVPRLAGVAGAAYSISTPYKYKLRGYVALRVTP